MTEATKVWDHKDEWRKTGNNCRVVVSRHNGYYDTGRKGVNRWAVYAWIYPPHPLFAKFDGTNDCYQNGIDDMPFHGDITLLRYHRGDSDKITEVTAIQVGADYDHLYDERYSFISTKDEAGDIFTDADLLLSWLNIKGSE